MSSWNAHHYLQFGGERTRPAADLVSRIEISVPKTVIDLGCGPGNSTQVLRQRWPDARVAGLDSSAEMIEAAREKFPDQEWVLSDAAAWRCPEPVDVVFSNAALQWIERHDRLVPGLFGQVAKGGAFAFQIPSDKYAAVRRHIHEIADDPAWRDRMTAPLTVLTMEDPSFYYDVLAEHARKLDIWETEYCHVMDGAASIVDWISSTGLRPFLAVLEGESERNRFVEMLHARVADSYPLRRDGKVLFPFRRLFVVAYR